MPATVNAREALLRDDHQILSRTAIEQGRAAVRMPNQPGVYTLTYDDGTKPEKMFSINPSPKESQLAFIDGSEHVKVWQVNLGTADARPAAAAAGGKLSLSGVLQQHWWWWMVVAGLVLLMLEMALAGARQERV